MGVGQIDQPEYGNWVSSKLLSATVAMSVPFLGLSFIFPSLAVGAVLSLVAFAYLAYARHKFSEAGGNLQGRIRNLVIEHLDWAGEGKALDIGCGNGPLAIELAKRHPNAQVTGIDYWGGVWEYSKAVCDKNAEIEGAAGHVNFQKTGADSLPFEEESFEAVVSNLVFHEVRGVRDKRELVKEALRVVKKGGAFSFQDLFLSKQQFGDIDALVATIESWGVTKVTFARTSDSPFIPKALRLPFMLGRMGIVYGTK